MQKIKYNDNMIVIDYAHTPDALENVLETVKQLKYDNIYTVIGCGGDRDKFKRNKHRHIDICRPQINVWSFRSGRIYNKQQDI